MSHFRNWNKPSKRSLVTMIGSSTKFLSRRQEGYPNSFSQLFYLKKPQRPTLASRILLLPFSETFQNKNKDSTPRPFYISFHFSNYWNKPSQRSLVTMIGTKLLSCRQEGCPNSLSQLFFQQKTTTAYIGWTNLPTFARLSLGRFITPSSNNQH